MSTDGISFRTIGSPPQMVFLNGVKIGRVEFRGDGWNAFDLGGDMLGFAEGKLAAARMIAGSKRVSS